MFRFFLNGGLQHNRSILTQTILYSTKQLPKNVLAVEPKSNNEQKHRVKYEVNKRISAEPLPTLKAVSLDEVREAHILKDVPKVVQDVAAVEKNKTIINWEPSPLSDSSKLINQYLMLSKIRLTTLVVITTMVGYAMAPAPFDLSTFAYCTVGTGLCSAAANSVNQYHEVPFDAQMARTKNRVLVRGQLTPLHSINFAIASAAIGTGLLYFGANGYAAALGAGNLFLYTSVYTPMKRVSILNTWIGSVVGAIPPIIGWVGCSGSFDAGSLLLAALMYSWQFPHFNALSWNLRPDYSRAGYRMMAVSHPALCRRTALRHTIALGVFSALAPVLDVTNIWFALEMFPLNAYYIYLAYKFYQKSDSGSSRKLFRFSLIQLPILMILFFVNKKEWISKKENSTKMTSAPQLTQPSIVTPTVESIL